MKSLSPQRLVKRIWRSAWALVLVPVIFFTGLPRLGCICADGHFEQFCPVLKQARAAAGRVTKGSATCCGCVGCSNTTGRKSCCQTGCQRPLRSDDGRTSLDTVSGCCCTPAIQVPPTPVKAKEVEGLSSPTVQTIMLVELLAPASVGHAFAAAHESWSGPPVADLVIVLQRLTI